MKLIIGLGNPGKKYATTWHNLGYMALDLLAHDSSAKEFKANKKFEAEIAQTEIAGQKIILAKPLTFMNLSGQSVKKIMAFYKLKISDLIVVHDDLDLPIGKIRIAQNSSSGGHNGIKSIIEELNDQNFIRLKLGIASDLLNQISAPDYVLMKIPKEQKKLIDIVLINAIEAIKELITEKPEAVMNKYN